VLFSTLEVDDGVWRTMMETVSRATTTVAWYASGSAQSSATNANLNGVSFDVQGGGMQVGGLSFPSEYSNANIGEAIFFAGSGGSLSVGDRGTIFAADLAYWGAN